MILFAAAFLAAASPAQLGEAERALAAGRSEQARTMIAAAVADGAAGPEVDRLLADLAFAERRWEEAVARYRLLIDRGPADALLLERAGIALLSLGEAVAAKAMLDRATALPDAGWRSWNACGVLLDRLGDWAGAARAYDEAQRLAPERAEPLANRGWSLTLQGRWNEAEVLLAQAAARDSGQARIRANLDLVRGALAEALPERRAGEPTDAYAARLNDVGVAAWRSGRPRRASAAFAEALIASDRWFALAADNLALVERN